MSSVEIALMSSGLSYTSKMLKFSTILSFLTDFWNADNFSLCQPPQVSIDTAIRNAQDMRHKSQLFFHGL